MERMKLKAGYSLRWGDQTGRTCGSGATVEVDVIYRGECVRTLVTCPCGRGCGNKACVVDDWGYHDTDIEDIRADLPTNPQKRDVPAGEPEGVKGFVSIRCGGCGMVVNTCLHEKRTIFNCKACGHPNRLEGLKSMKVECPRCSFRGLYKTNREESPIVMECLNCSQPVPLRKGYRRGNYVTVRERSE